ncbi:MAG: molybdopterin dinucleotide binding domain-containing protein, partial [Planctomycetota bacterium]
EALADFQIFRAIAHYWGLQEEFKDWTSPEAVFEIMQELSKDQPCDITGIDGYTAIDAAGGIQWPWSESDKQQNPSPETNRRLFADGQFYTADKRARLIVDDITPMPEPPCDQYPWMLLTGRGTVSQWHTQTRTSKSPLLRKLYPQECYIEMNRVDAERLGVANGDQVQLSSRRGQVTANVVITSTVRPQQIFMPMHYEETNQLTLPHFDPYSHQPSYKNCAVNIRRV